MRSLPIRDGAVFPLEYTLTTQKARTVSYKPSPEVSLCAADDLAAFNRKSLAHGFKNAVHWAEACSKGTGFKACPACPDISMLEKWSEHLSPAGIIPVCGWIFILGCISRSLQADCRFDSINLTVEFNGYPVCLLLFVKQKFPDSGKEEVYASTPEIRNSGDIGKCRI